METPQDQQRLNDLAARHFPLVARPQVISRPISVRLHQIESRTDDAQQGGPDSITRAAQALNLAALLASDTGDSRLARDLCWLQFEQFREAGPLPASAAQLALQPLINLARLETRAGRGHTAFELLNTLFSAVTTRTAVPIDGRTIELSTLTGTDEDHRGISTWMRKVVLIDGTRALARAGDWETALTYVEQLHGIGSGLDDGRQIAILARTFSRQHEAALALLDTSDLATPWETAVASCLRLLSKLMTGDDPRQLAAQLAKSSVPCADPAMVAPTSRLAMTVLDFVEGIPEADPGPLVEFVAQIATSPGGGYAAQELLHHRGFSMLPEPPLRTSRRSSGSSAVGRTGRARSSPTAVVGPPTSGSPPPWVSARRSGSTAPRVRRPTPST